MLFPLIESYSHRSQKKRENMIPARLAEEVDYMAETKTDVCRVLENALASTNLRSVEMDKVPKTDPTNY
jgi:hypothetical protein